MSDRAQRHGESPQLYRDGQLQMALIERGALDEIEIYVMPELLGGGKPLFPATGHRGSPRLIDAKALDRGCVRLHYRFRSRKRDMKLSAQMAVQPVRARHGMFALNLT